MRKIIEGERDLRKIKLEEGFRLSEHPLFEILQETIKTEARPIQDMSKGHVYRLLYSTNRLMENPIDVSGSEFRYLVAKGLYLPHLEGSNADFSYANFSDRLNPGKYQFQGSNFTNATFYKTRFSFGCFLGINFRNANLENAVLLHARICYTAFDNANLRNTLFYNTELSQCCFTGADVEGASFKKAKFDCADIRYVKNLEKSQGLDSAVFQSTKVMQKELDIIKDASERFILYE